MFDINEFVFTLIYLLMTSVHCANTAKPNFCGEDYADSVFNRMSIEKNGTITSFITLTRGDWRWTYNSRTKTISEPELMRTDSIEETGFHIYQLPDRTCAADNSRCAQLNKMRGLAAVISLNRNTMQNSVQFYKILNSSTTVHNITDSSEMPWSMSASGYLVDEEDKLWPKGWVTNKHKPVAYISRSNELIFIINGAKTQLNAMWLSGDDSHRLISWSDGSVEYHSMFELDDTVYAVGVNKKAQMKVFDYNAINRLMSVTVRQDKTLRSLFNCTNINNESDANNYNKWLIIGWILAIVLIILIIAVVVVFVYWRRFKRKSTKVSKTASFVGKVDSSKSMKSHGTINSETGLKIRSESSLT